MFWLAILVFVAATAWIVARIRRTVKERERAEEARAANLLAGLIGTAGPAADAPATASAPADPSLRPASAAAIDELAQHKLLLDSARMASEAGEPALAIQLYGRLLVRYPASSLVAEARAAVEALKKKLVNTKP